MSTITITGNLVRDPELRFTPAGQAVANLTVAENHRRKAASGDWEDAEPTYWPVTVWGDYAEHVAESLTAGHRVVVIGRSRTRCWTPDTGAHAGVEQRRLELVADEVTPSLRWATATVTKAAATSRAQEPPAEDEPPF